MHRELTTHRVSGLNERLTVVSTDDVGPGGAFYDYCISIDHAPSHRPIDSCEIHFHKGDLAKGANGISSEALLSIIEDRLTAFQSGPLACRENALALLHVQDARMCLQSRHRLDGMKGHA